MCSESVCRLCLATDAPVRLIADTPLQRVYENLTNVSLNNGHKPVVACGVCYWQLRKCHNLMTKSMRADELLTKILQTGASIIRESVVAVDRKLFKLNNHLNKSQMELAVFIKPEHVIKEEIKIEPQSCPEKELDSEQPFVIGIKLENLEDIDNKAERQEDLNDIICDGWTDEHNNLLKEEAVESDKEIDVMNVTHEIADSYDTLHKEKVALAVEDTDYEIDIMNDFINDGFTYGLDMYEEEVGLDDIDIEETVEIETLEDTNVEQEEGDDLAKKFKSAEKTSLTVKNIKKYKAKTRDEISNDANIQYVLETTSESTAKLNKTHTYYTLKPKSDASSETFSKYVLPKHVEDNKGWKTNKKNEQKLYECTVCQRIFRFKKVFKRHLKTHSLPHTCVICQRAFKIKACLDNHFKIHTGEKPFKCNICQRRFIEKSNYNRHVKTHTGEKPFKCDICQHAFITKMNLINHLIIHTGEKPFKCEICEHRFSHERSLRKHIILHTGEKPFKCDICEYSCYRKEHLNRHLKKHDGQRKRPLK